MSIKMIVTDLDGTLLRGDKTVSKYTWETLRKCRLKGLKVAYATGRGGSAQHLAPSEMFDGRITMNGAIGKIGEDTVYNRLIPHQVARPILIACHRRGMAITSSITGMHYSGSAITGGWSHIPNYEIVDFMHHNIDAEKICISNPTPDDREFIEQLLPESLYFVVTADYESNTLGQIMHKEATKSKAVLELARIWGINQSEIVVFGDDFNDIDMLQNCGIAVAMANAIPEVKAVADHICQSNDDDGVAKWLEENVC